MHTLRASLALGAAIVLATPAAIAQRVTEVGNAPMFPSKDIIANAVNSKEHTTLVAAVKAAGLVETLQGPGPFTVFAPTDAAFAKLPDGTVASLLEPEAKSKLQAILTYHVVPGRIDAATMKKLIADDGGVSTTIKTVQGDNLTLAKNGYNYVVKDKSGSLARISTYDVYQSNGVIHVIESVLLP